MTLFNTQSKPDSTSTLLGIALDVSGSMQESIRNDAAMNISRLDGVGKGLQAMVRDARRLARERSSDLDFPLRVFAYAFGLRTSRQYGDLLSILRAASDPETQRHVEVCTARRRLEAEEKGRAMRQGASSWGGLASVARSYGFGGVVDDLERGAEAQARRRLTSEAEEAVMEDVRVFVEQRFGDTTLTLAELGQLCGSGETSLEAAERFVFGSTPLKGCLQEIEQRFAREAGRDVAAGRVLLVISDGAPTDGNPGECAARIRQSGVITACAYVTSDNVHTPRRLPSRPDPGWPEGARLMFNMASAIDELPDAKAWRQMLTEANWETPDGARLFVQVNHSEVLADFMRVAAVAFPARRFLGNIA